MLSDRGSHQSVQLPAAPVLRLSQCGRPDSQSQRRFLMFCKTMPRKVLVMFVLAALGATSITNAALARAGGFVDGHSSGAHLGGIQVGGYRGAQKPRGVMSAHSHDRGRLGLTGC